MGAVGGGSGGGSQGPMGPMGPMGPSGPPGPAGPQGPAGIGFDPVTSPLGVFCRHVIPPFSVVSGAWIALPVTVPEYESQAGLIGPGGRFFAPLRGYYLFTASLRLATGQVGFSLRILRDGTLVETESRTGLDGLQISTQVLLQPQQSLHVEIRATAGSVMIDGGPPRSMITINGIGQPS